LNEGECSGEGELFELLEYVQAFASLELEFLILLRELVDVHLAIPEFLEDFLLFINQRLVPLVNSVLQGVDCDASTLRHVLLLLSLQEAYFLSELILKLLICHKVFIDLLLLGHILLSHLLQLVDNLRLNSESSQNCIFLESEVLQILLVLLKVLELNSVESTELPAHVFCEVGNILCLELGDHFGHLV